MIFYLIVLWLTRTAQGASPQAVTRTFILASARGTCVMFETAERVRVGGWFVANHARRNLVAAGMDHRKQGAATVADCHRLECCRATELAGTTFHLMDERRRLIEQVFDVLWSYRLYVFISTLEDGLLLQV